MGQRPPQLGKQVVGNDQLEVAREPSQQQACGCATSGQQCCDEHVDVKHGPHLGAAASPCCFLSLQGEFHRLILAERILRPEPVEELETKVPTERFLNDLAVALALPGSSNLYEAHDLLVECQCGSDLAHICIIASRCERLNRSTRCCATGRRPLRQGPGLPPILLTAPALFSVRQL